MIGCDIQNIAKIKAPERLLSKIATEHEIVWANFTGNLKKRVGTLWAIKESVFKALDMEFSLPVFKEIEYNHKSTGRPYIKLIGKAKDKFKSLGCSTLDISVSHTDDLVIAVCQIY